MSVDHVPRVGRPRRFDEVTERTLLLDAGLVVIQRNGYAAATLTEIVEEAGLARRAFYRHFDTKDAVLNGVFAREAEKVDAALRQAVSSAPTGKAGLEAWLDTYINLFTNPPQRKRVAALSSDEFRRAAGYAAELRRIDALYAAPLTEALRRAVAEGEIHVTDPAADARIVLAVVKQVGESLMATARPSKRRGVVQVQRYCWPALGLAPPGG
jgi:AcrR family transcriptional regulator